MNEENKIDSWKGIWALALGVSGIMIAEFLPAGVLTSMASDLKITEGMAGQAVTATSIFAVIASLMVAYVTRNLNRKSVLIALSSFMWMSSFVVALSSNFFVLIFGRVLLGISLGGFWSMAAAIALRLVAPKNVPKALSIIFGSASFSAVLAAPLGSYLGNIIGWRSTFIASGVVGLIGTIWQVASLPSLKPNGVVKLRTIIDVMKLPQFAHGLIAIGFAFCGRFASITYLRPFLENEMHLHGTMVSVAFLVFDAAYFVGTLFAASLVSKSMKRSLIYPPIILALTSFGLMFNGERVVIAVILLAVLGISFAPLPVAWSTWITATAPENTETAGGLYVASIQFSAALGAMVGGIVFDSVGPDGVFALCGITWLISSLVVLMKIKTRYSEKLVVGTAH